MIDTGPLSWIMLVAAVIACLLIVRRRWYGLSDAPRRPHALGPGLAVALAAALVLAGALGAGFVARMIWDGPPPTDGVQTLGEQARLLLGRDVARLLVLAVFVAAFAAAPRPDPDRRLPLPRAVGIGAVALLLLWPIVQAVSLLSAWLAVGLGGVEPDVVAHETLRLMREGPADGWLVVVAVLVVVAAPVFEEVLYRGLVQDALGRVGLPPWAAIAVTSFLFVLMHVGAVEPYALPSLFVLSAGFGWAYERSGRLTMPIVMHALFNLGNLLLAFVTL